TNRRWLHELARFAGLGTSTVAVRSGRAFAQAGAQAPAGAARPKPANFAWPQKNTSLPYAIRSIPWAKRRGAKVWPNGARIAFIPHVTLEMFDFAQPARVQVFESSGGGGRGGNTATGFAPADCVTGANFGAVVGVHRIAEHVKQLGIPFTMVICGSFGEE